MAGVLSALIGCLVLSGWALGIDRLKSIAPGFDTMKPDAALAFVLAGMALSLAAKKESDGWTRWLPRTLAIVVELIALVTLVEYSSGWNLGINQWLFWAAGEPHSAVPAHMAPDAAISFLFVSPALLLIDARNARAQMVSSYLAVAAGSIALLALAGYAYGFESANGADPYIHMALYAAATFLVLCAGILMARPDRGLAASITGESVGAIVLRRLLPVAIGAPLFIGWLVLQGYRAGAYEEVVSSSLVAFSSIAVITALVWSTSVHLNQLDAARRSAEEALWASQARFKAAAEGSLDAFFILESVRDASGRIADFKFLEVNSRGAKLISTPRDAVLGQSLCELLPHNRTQGFLEKYARVVETGEPLEEEFPISVPEIDARWLRHQVTKVGDGIAITSRDVTERRQAEEEKTRLANDLRLLLDSTDEGLYGVDVKGLCTFVNGSAARMLGYSVAEALDKNMHDLIHHTCLGGQRYFEDDCLIHQAFHEGRGVRVDSEVFWRKDGSSFPIEYSSYLIIEDGVIKGAVVAFTDITERKQAGERIKKLNEDLTRRAVELTVTNKELEAFSYSVSHDLRAPLRSIDGFSLALLEDYGGSLDPEGRDYLHRVRAASQRMGELIDDMLALSRLTRSEMRREEVNLSATADRIATELRRSDPKRHAEFVIEPDLVAHGDARLLEVALENLLGNAWKFTSRQPWARIELGATKLDGARTFCVKDNGAGFDMAYAGKLFGAFQRLHGTTEFPGNGVGLATVQRIIHRHGGRIWAEGEVGRGATFYFTL